MSDSGSGNRRKVETSESEDIQEVKEDNMQAAKKQSSLKTRREKL
ncbi:MAG TPA: hypothetical protein VFN98_02150 [Nitrososphaeraceae archaeon]|nr:hypothetical protein [Nitrososphaeraceae archaeon]